MYTQRLGQIKHILSAGVVRYRAAGLPRRFMKRNLPAHLTTSVLLLMMPSMTSEARPGPNADPLTATISAQIQRIWEAYQQKDAATHNALLTDDYYVIHPSGSILVGKPTPETIAREAIAGFKIYDLRVKLLAPDAALSTYMADVDLPPGTQPPHIRFAASSVWRKEHGEWK